MSQRVGVERLVTVRESEQFPRDHLSPPSSGPAARCPLLAARCSLLSAPLITCLLDLLSFYWVELRYWVQGGGTRPSRRDDNGSTTIGTKYRVGDDTHRELQFGRSLRNIPSHCSRFSSSFVVTHSRSSSIRGPRGSDDRCRHRRRPTIVQPPVGPLPKRPTRIPPRSSFRNGATSASKLATTRLPTKRSRL